MGGRSDWGSVTLFALTGRRFELVVQFMLSLGEIAALPLP
jgi:hypothetical protein